MSHGHLMAMNRFRVDGYLGRSGGVSDADQFRIDMAARQQRIAAWRRQQIQAAQNQAVLQARRAEAEAKTQAAAAAAAANLAKTQVDVAIKATLEGAIQRIALVNQHFNYVLSHCAQFQPDSQPTKEFEVVTVEVARLKDEWSHLGIDDKSWSTICTFRASLDKARNMLFGAEEQRQSFYKHMPKELKGALESAQNEIQYAAHIAVNNHEAAVILLQQNKLQTAYDAQIKLLDEQAAKGDTQFKEALQELNTFYAENIERAPLAKAVGEFTDFGEKLKGVAFRQYLDKHSTPREGIVIDQTTLMHDRLFSFVSDFGADINKAAKGLQAGFLGSFKGTTDVLAAIYDQPELCIQLSTHIMNVLTDPIMTKEALKHVKDYVQQLVFGTAEEKGELLGAFAGMLSRQWQELKYSQQVKALLNQWLHIYARQVQRHLGKH